MLDFSAKPPEDGDLVVGADINAFLDWYAQLVPLPKYVGVRDHWHHALQTLMVKELRAGAREFKAKHLSRGYVGPVAFWHLCRMGWIPESDWRRHVGRSKYVDPES